MTKRRNFIRKSILGTAGIAISGTGFSSGSYTSTISDSAQKNWQSDPIWRKVKYGEWAGPGVSARPGPMDEILLKDWAPRSLVVSQETFVAKAKYPAREGGNIVE